MPLGGETIGTAFVRVVADGSGLDEDVRRDFSKAGKVGGEEFGKEYNKGWITEFEKGLDESQKAFAKNQKEMINQNRGFRSQLTKTAKEIDRINASFENNTKQMVRRSTGLLEMVDHELSRVDEETINRRERMEKSFSGFLTRIETKSEHTFGRMRNTIHEAFDIDADAHHGERGLRRLANGWDNFVERLPTGRGARNDFFNIFGIFIEGSLKLLSVLPKLADGLGQVFSGGGGGGGGAKFLQFVGSAGASLAGLAVVIGVVITIIGPFVTLILGAAAALIALAGSAAFAAAAVGGVALALAPVLVGAIGVAVLALTHLDKETKAAAKSMGKSFQELGKSAGEAIGPGLRRTFDILRPAIADLEPLVDNIAEALGRVAVGWARVLRSPAFIAFRDSMETFLPNAIESLGRSFGNFGRGMLRVFVALEPLANRFLGWLEKITGEFARWTARPENQQKLVDFFDRAGDSAKAVGDFLAAAARALGNLLSKGRGTGDDILTSLTDQLNEWTDWLNDPKNQDSLREFFDNGKQTAEDLGNTVLALSDTVNELNTEENKKRMHDLFLAIEDVAAGLQHVIDLVNIINEGGGTAVMSLVWGEGHSPADIAGALSVNLFPAIAIPVKLILDDHPEMKSKFAKGFNDFISDVGSKISFAWSKFIPDVNWSEFIPDLGPAWKKFTKTLKWSNVIPDVKWKNFIPPLHWDQFVKVLKWFTYVSLLKWATFITKIDWGEFISDIKWLSWIGKLDWSTIIPDIEWSDFVPDLNIVANIDWPSPPSWLSKLDPRHAVGGVFAAPTRAVIGEAGPEAVVPLNRPLAMVDPSVRALSAFAQGLPVPGATTNNRNRTIDVGGITVVTPTRDPRAVAVEVVNRLAVAGY